MHGLCGCAFHYARHRSIFCARRGRPAAYSRFCDYLNMPDYDGFNFTVALWEGKYDNYGPRKEEEPAAEAK